MRYNLASKEITLSKEEIEEILAWIMYGVNNVSDSEARSSGKILIIEIQEMIT